MQRERLTRPRITAFKSPEGQQQAFLWDTVAPRLAVRATVGAKSFVFEAKLNRQTIRRTIGDVRAWNLDDARAEANRLQTMIDQGTDPRELDRERAAAIATAKAAREAAVREAESRKHYTLRAMCSAYVDHLRVRGKLKTARDVKSAFNVHVFSHPTIADLPAREVTSHQIAAMVRKVREAGKERTAGILRNYLVAAFNAARRAPFDSGMSSELIKFDVTDNPAAIVPAIAVNRGERVLSSDELKEYVSRLGNDQAGQALQVALLAGSQRMAQLLRAKVSDYDEETQTLRLWDAKGKRRSAREHLLPLGPKAAVVVMELVAQRCDVNGSILDVSERTAGNRLAQISAAMGGETFGLRDIRRTTETMLASMGISRDTRAQLLSHGISGVQDAHYDKYSYTNEKRAALVAWEARLDEIQTGKRASNVVQMHSA